MIKKRYPDLVQVPAEVLSLLEAAVRAVAPACRAWFDALPPSISDGVDGPGIGYPEVKAVLRAAALLDAMDDATGGR